jgi:hypothetical protein
MKDCGYVIVRILKCTVLKTLHNKFTNILYGFLHIGSWKINSQCGRKLTSMTACWQRSNLERYVFTGDQRRHVARDVSVASRHADRHVCAANLGLYS